MIAVAFALPSSSGLALALLMHALTLAVSSIGGAVALRPARLAGVERTGRTGRGH